MSVETIKSPGFSSRSGEARNFFCICADSRKLWNRAEGF